MKKHVLIRGLIGFMAGITIELLVALSISIIQGELLLFTPDFLALCGNNPMVAYGLQHALVGLIGIAFAEASISFQQEGWSFGKQYLIFCITTTAVWIPVSMVCWFPQNLRGVLSLAISFFCTYLINWVIQLSVSRKNVRLLNERLKAAQGRQNL